MPQKANTISIVAIALLLTGSCLLAFQYSKSRKEVKSLTSEVHDLERDIKRANERIAELEEEKSDLEQKLANVQHFDDFGSPGQGYSEAGMSYTGRVLETQIDGTFEGWDGETIFKMMNGTIWQQASYDYTYHYAYMPDVLIYRKGGSYYMRVEDVDDEIQVRQIR